MYSHQSFFKVVHVSIIDQENQKAFVRNPGNGYLKPRYFYHSDVRVSCKEVYL